MCTGLQTANPPQLQEQKHISEAEERRLLVDVMPHYLSLELRGHSIPWSEIQEVHFPDRTAAWSKLEPSQSSEFREGALVWGGLSLAAAARWRFGHPPLQTVAQGHYTLGEPREERALAPKHLDAEEARAAA